MGESVRVGQAAPGLCRGEGPDRGPQSRPHGYRAAAPQRLRQAHRPGGRGCRLKTIEITVDNKGHATVQTKGFTGASCQDASRFIEQSLGEKTSEKLTQEFYQLEFNQ